MADETNDQQLVQNAIDFLGKRQPISLTGTTALPTNTALGIPAPSNAPGGLSGFGGGAGGPIGGPGQPNLLSGVGEKIGDVLKRLGPQEPTRGDTGGVSLSDQIRSGPTPSGNTGATNANAPLAAAAGGAAGTATDVATAPVGIGSITAGGGTTAGALPMNTIAGQLETGLGLPPGSLAGMSSADLTEIANLAGNVGTAEAGQVLGLGETGAGFATPEQLAAIGAGGGAGTLTGLAAGGAGALVGALPGLIGQFAGADPKTQAGLEVGGTALGAVATPAISGALGVGGGAGGAAGAGAGLAAAGPGLIAAAPVAAGFIADQVAEMLDTKQAAYELGQRVKNIGPQLPGELEQLNSIPAIAAKINSATTPEEAKALMEQLNKIYTGFEQGGWESYAKQGQTTVGGGSAGKDVSAKLPGVQSALEAETPNLNAGNVARLRLEDIMGKAGMTPDQIPGYLDPVNLALMLNAQPGDAIGNEAFTGAPGPLRGALLPGAIQDIGNFNITGPVTGAQAKALGLDPNVTYSPQDIQNYLLGAGQNTIKSTPYGEVASSVYDPLAALKPGNLEAGITQFLQQYGGVGPAFAGYNLGGGTAPAPAPAAPVDTGGGTSATGGTAATTVAQQAIDALGGQSGTPTDLSDFMLSDEQLKAMGVR